MFDDQYAKFWSDLQERYPDFSPTLKQTDDWRIALRNKDVFILEAAVSTVICEKTGNQPKLPWFIDAYNRVVNDRKRSEGARTHAIEQGGTDEAREALQTEKEQAHRSRVRSAQRIGVSKVLAMRDALVGHGRLGGCNGDDINEWSQMGLLHIMREFEKEDNKQ